MHAQPTHKNTTQRTCASMCELQIETAKKMMRQMGPATLRINGHMGQERGAMAQRGDKGLVDCAAAVARKVNSSGRGSSRDAAVLTSQATPCCWGGLQAGKRVAGQPNTFWDTRGCAIRGTCHLHSQTVDMMYITQAEVQVSLPRTPAPTTAQKMWATAVKVVPAAGGQKERSLLRCEHHRCTRKTTLRICGLEAEMQLQIWPRSKPGCWARLSPSRGRKASVAGEAAAAAAAAGWHAWPCPRAFGLRPHQ
jgi:hypothetical protein